MSCSYAEGLSEYHDKGKLGLPEKFDNQKEIDDKVELLAEWISKAKCIVVHTGAGISTSAGIPDFRGPKGVWTLEKRGEKPEMNVSWDDAQPTKTHMALAKLVEVGKVSFIVTQNIDGLHLRTGVSRNKIAELHGNMFVDQCDKCHKMFVRDSPAPTVGQKYLGGDCPATRYNGRNCRGRLKDFVLDWEADLPDADLTLSDSYSMMADLSIVMGSTLQIIPAGNMPTYCKKYQENGKLVICNLQPTKQDKKADLSIHTYVDDVMEMVMKKLGLKIPQYNKDLDPVRLVGLKRFPEGELYIDWTQSEEKAREIKKVGDRIHDEYLKRKREEKKRKSSLEVSNNDFVKTNKLQKVDTFKEVKSEKDFKHLENGFVDKADNVNGEQIDNGKQKHNFDLKDLRKRDIIENFDIMKTEGCDNVVGDIDELANFRKCKKTDSYRFETDLEPEGQNNSYDRLYSTPYTPTSRTCKKTDSYNFEDEEIS